MVKYQDFSWIPWNLSFRYIHCTGQFTPKMKANAEPRSLSSLVWIDSGVVVSQHYLESFFMEFMMWLSFHLHNTALHCVNQLYVHSMIYFHLTHFSYKSHFTEWWKWQLEHLCLSVSSIVVIACLPHWNFICTLRTKVGPSTFFGASACHK